MVYGAWKTSERAATTLQAVLRAVPVSKAAYRRCANRGVWLVSAE